MAMLVLQTLLLTAIAYILGCIVGCLLHRWFAAVPKAETAAAPVAAPASTRLILPAPPAPPAPAAPVPPASSPPRSPTTQAAAKPKRAPAKRDARRKAESEALTSTGKAAESDVGSKPPTIARPRGGKADNLTLIDGVGVAIGKKLFALGIHHFDQIAEWTDAHQTWIGNELGFPGRPQRENWVKEAKTLASGGAGEHTSRAEARKTGASRRTGIVRKK